MILLYNYDYKCIYRTTTLDYLYSTRSSFKTGIVLQVPCAVQELRSTNNIALLLDPFCQSIFHQFWAVFWANSPNVHLNLWQETINNLSAQQIPSNEANFRLFVWPIYSNVGRFLVCPSIQFGVNHQNINKLRV